MFFAKKPAQPAQHVVKQQQRLSYRASLQLPVRFAIIGKPGSEMGKILDLSTGGIRFGGPEKLDPESDLVFAFRLPSDVLAVQPPNAKVKKTKFDDIQTRGKIVKVFTHDQYGIAFSGIDGHAQEEIRTYLHLLQLFRIKKERQA